ncbi:MAG: hypothetical protein M0R51_14970 [Clostridia bacterium]|jgi:hypothetical protein|nr:hypothetical protein [Clostridia bacterium]
MANSIENIGTYMTNLVDEVMVHESKTQDLVNAGMFVSDDFVMKGWVKVAEILLGGLGWYLRANHQEVAGANSSNYADYNGNNGTGLRDGYPINSSSLTWTLYRLRYDRATQFKIDYIDNEEAAGIQLGKLEKTFLDRELIPEVDATRFSILTDNTNISLGNRVENETIAANTIVAKFNSSFTWLFEHGVPEQDQIIYINPTIMELIRNTTELTKFLTQENYKSADGLDFTVQKYANRKIIEVPSDRFFTNVVLGDNGYSAGTSSYRINFMVVDKLCASAIVKLQTVKQFGVDVVQDFDGYKVNFHLYHDIIVPHNKVVGIYASISGTLANTLVRTVAIASQAGDLQNLTKITGVWTQPAGTYYSQIVVKDTAFTEEIGATITPDANITSDGLVVTLNQQFTPTGTTIYVALLDDKGVCVAKSRSAIAVTKHA